jgi:hypothetical protein
MSDPFDHLLKRANELKQGDDTGLRALFADMLAANISEMRCGPLMAAAKAKTKFPIEQIRDLFAEMKVERDEARRNTPEAREAERRAREAEAEAARIVREAERDRLWRSCSSIAISRTLLADMEDLVHRLGVVGEGPSIKGTYLSMTSRLLKVAISLLRRGAAAGGKNYLIIIIQRIIPTESVISISSSSPQALIYHGDDVNALKHKIIVIAEAAAIAPKANGDENPMAIMLRTLLSEGRIDRMIAIPQPNGQTPKTVHVRRDGPVCLVLTSARDNVEAEMLTRLMSSDADESDEQTRQILRKIMSGKCEQVSEDEIRRWLDYQRWLEIDMPESGYAVTIPFEAAILDTWLDLLKGDPAALQLRLRRDATAFKAAIEASAVLHKAQRQTDENGRIIAELADYKNAFDAFNAGMAALYDIKPTDAVARALAVIVEMAQSQDAESEIRDGVGYKISVEDLRKGAGIPSKSTASDRLKKLVDLGALEIDEDMRSHGRGAPTHYKIKKMSLGGTTGNVFPLVADVQKAWKGDEQNEQNEQNAENFEGGSAWGVQTNGIGQPIDFKATNRSFGQKPEIRTETNRSFPKDLANERYERTEITDLSEPFDRSPPYRGVAENSALGRGEEQASAVEPHDPPPAKAADAGSSSFTPVCEFVGPAGIQRCALCDKSGRASRFRVNGEEYVWHDHCATPENIIAAVRRKGGSFDSDGNPDLRGVSDPAAVAALIAAVSINVVAIREAGTGTDPQPASVPFMLTQNMKRRLRDRGYSDEQITQLTPQQAHEILAHEGRRANA